MATLTDIEQQIEDAIQFKGKLLMIQELSDWLDSQPLDISKIDLLDYLMHKAGEMS